jgi:DNA polymerase
MSKTEALAALERELAVDASLPFYGQANLVFGEGDPDAAVVFIGEAPGEREDQLKRPFVGRAGQLLDRLIEQIGWKRGDVYITNVIKRRPPQNRDPLPAEIEAYAPYLARQIEILNPKVIAPLGRFAMNYFLPDAKISRDQGKVFKVGNQLVVPLYHTAAALRSPQVLDELTASFKRLPDIVAGTYTAVELPPAYAPKSVKPKPPPQAKLF